MKPEDCKIGTRIANVGYPHQVGHIAGEVTVTRLGVDMVIVEWDGQGYPDRDLCDNLILEDEGIKLQIQLDAERLTMEKNFEEFKELFAAKMKLAADEILGAAKLLGGNTDDLTKYQNEVQPVLDAINSIGWHSSSNHC
jgi:hypothetical protein